MNITSKVPFYRVSVFGRYIPPAVRQAASIRASAIQDFCEAILQRLHLTRPFLETVDSYRLSDSA
jgi:hypothetical protein